MGLKYLEQRLSGIDEIFSGALKTARIPGAAIAVVHSKEIVFARGYGYLDLQTQSPMTAETVYPIASTTKAINATLIGMLVDSGTLSWDEPVQSYLPSFRLGDCESSCQVTIRDLLTMRTGLPRHDWLWVENPLTRAELVRRLRYLPLSAGFREKFQYNNLTATTAGHIAEVVSARSWEDLVRENIAGPLSMTATVFGRPPLPNVTQCYHEGSQRNLLPTQHLNGNVTGPSGGSIHSTVIDMARWIAFNLAGGSVQGRQLIESKTLLEIQSPQVVARTDPACPTPNAAYGMGWFVDTYNGRARVAHGGYLHDVSSSVMLLPQNELGLVSFINFGPPRLSRLLNEHVSDLLLGATPVESVSEKLEVYERKVAENRRRLDSLTCITNAPPSHGLNHYTGIYEHAAYGELEVRLNKQSLTLHRGALALPMEHWHYDAWAFTENDLFDIRDAHCFDRGSRVLYETNLDGEISALSVQLEPAVAPIRFAKRRVTAT